MGSDGNCSGLNWDMLLPSLTKYNKSKVSHLSPQLLLTCNKKGKDLFTNEKRNWRVKTITKNVQGESDNPAVTGDKRFQQQSGSTTIVNFLNTGDDLEHIKQHQTTHTEGWSELCLYSLSVNYDVIYIISKIT